MEAALVHLSRCQRDDAIKALGTPHPWQEALETVEPRCWLWHTCDHDDDAVAQPVAGPPMLLGYLMYQRRDFRGAAAALEGERHWFALLYLALSKSELELHVEATAAADECVELHPGDAYVAAVRDAIAWRRFGTQRCCKAFRALEPAMISQQDRSDIERMLYHRPTNREASIQRILSIWRACGAPMVLDEFEALTAWPGDTWHVAALARSICAIRSQCKDSRAALRTGSAPETQVPTNLADGIEIVIGCSTLSADETKIASAKCAWNGAIALSGLPHKRVQERGRSTLQIGTREYYSFRVKWTASSCVFESARPETLARVDLQPGVTHPRTVRLLALELLALCIFDAVLQLRTGASLELRAGENPRHLTTAREYAARVIQLVTSANRDRMAPAIKAAQEVYSKRRAEKAAAASEPKRRRGRPRKTDSEQKPTQLECGQPHSQPSIMTSRDSSEAMAVAM